MGPKKLSETIDCDLKEAKELITKYFKAFPKIKILENLVRNTVILRHFLRLKGKDGLLTGLQKCTMMKVNLWS